MSKQSQKNGRKRALGIGLTALSIAIHGVVMAQEQGQTTSETLLEEELVVFGRRGAIERASELQRAADDFRSIVTADDVGQFGDPTVAETLQRIPGVSINRSNGEGEQVSIRGLPTEFATVTLNGARLGSSDADINSTNLDFFSADNLSRIDVIKTLTPEQDADAIAGAIDLKTISAFARGKDSYGGRIEYGYQERPDEYNPKVSADFTKLFDLDTGRLGLAAALSYSERTTLTDQRQANDGLFFLTLEQDGSDFEHDNDEDDCLDDDVVECYVLPEEFDERWDQRERTRLSFNGTIDYEVGDHTFALRGSFARSDTDRFNNRQTYDLSRSEGDIGDPDRQEIFELGVEGGNAFAAFIDGRSEIRARPQGVDEEVYTFGFEGTSIVSDDWEINYGFDLSSNESYQQQIEGRFRADDVAQIFSNLGRESIDIALISEQQYADSLEDPSVIDGPDTLDPALAASWELNNDRINERFTDSEDTYETFYVNIERQFEMMGRDAAFKFGAKVRNRERNNDATRLEWIIDFSDTETPDRTLSLADFNPSTDVDSDLNISFIPELSGYGRTLRDFVANNGRLATVEEVGTFIARADKENDFTAEEEVTAAYAQLTFNPADDVQIIAGIRVEQTDYTSTGTQFREVDYDNASNNALDDALSDGGVAQEDIDAFLAARQDIVPIEEFTGSNDYTDVFPSLNIRWEPTDDTLVRFSYTQGIKRPEFREAAAINQLSTDENLDDDILSDIIDDDFGGVLTSIADANAAIDAARAEQFAEDEDPAFETEGNNIRNPELDPLTSQNLDVSFDWYPNERTVLSIAAFYKEISDFIVPIGASGSGVTALGFLVDDFTVNSPGVSRVETFINGDDAEIMGLELSYYQAYTFLPQPFDGLFVQGNVTFADSEATAAEVERTFEFPDQSDVIGNLSVGWENEKFSIRTAVVYQGERLRALNDANFADANDPAGDELEDERTQVDVNIRYNITDDVQVYFDAINVNEAEDVQFYELGGSTSGNILNDAVFSDIEKYGATYQLGIRASF